MDDSPEEITGREWYEILGISVVVIILSLLLVNAISSAMLIPLTNMETAMRITDNTQFSYAMKTNYPGGIWATGTAVLVPVTEQHLNNSYGRIVVKKEQYTRHTYTTCTTINKVTTCVTHVYYSWDSDGSTDVITPTFTFMGTSFTKDQVSFDYGNRLPLQDNINTIYNDKMSQDYIYEQNPNSWFWNVDDIRYYFVVTPLTFDGTMYVRSNANGYINKDNNPCGCSISTQTPDQAIESAKSGLWFVQNVLWWLIPLLALIGLAIFFYYE